MKKKVLILGGTGAMGKALIEVIDKSFDVYVTSREVHHSDTVTYIQGDAHDRAFLKELLSNTAYEVVVDFLNYRLENFQDNLQEILPRVGQYVFTSSSRVYAPSTQPLTEDSPRLLDVCTDRTYLLTDEYALAKAREENYLQGQKSKNWTIIRPGLIYNDNRMQFALWEKEEWLYRALHGRKVLFPAEMEKVNTALCYAGDVARVLSRVIGNGNTLGEVYHIAGRESHTWQEIWNIYAKSIEEIAGVSIQAYRQVDAAALAEQFTRTYQYRYARGIDRRFSTEKLDKAIGKTDYTSIEQGIPLCMRSFLENGASFGQIEPVSEAKRDAITKEWAGLREFGGSKAKIKYLLTRLGIDRTSLGLKGE